MDRTWRNGFIGGGIMVALALSISSLAMSQSIRTTHAPGLDFSRYHTYRWVEIKGQHTDPTVDAQIKQSIDAQLSAKGLTKTTQAPDLNVDYQVAMSQAQKWEPYEDWTDTSLMGQRIQKYQKVSIEFGTLVIDMYDTAAKQLVWTGRASKTLDPKSTPETRRKNIEIAAQRLLATFPPK